MNNKKLYVAVLILVVVLLGVKFLPSFYGGLKNQDNNKVSESKNNTPKQSIVTLSIEGNNLEQTFKDNQSAYDLMVAFKNDGKLSFSGKDYKDMGYFVEEINGIKNGSVKNKYWIFYINGKSSDVSVSKYILQPNDKISWNFEESKF